MYMHSAMRKTPWRVRLNRMQSERSNFEAQWSEIDEFLAPGRYRDGHNAQENRGEKKHGAIINETALRARRVFVSGFMSGMTSPARPWFKLTTQDPEMAESSAVKKWLEEVERRMNIVFQASNFYQAMPSVYDDLGTFATGGLSVCEHPNTLAWFKPHPIGDYFVATDEWGQVDTIYRETKLTVNQMVERFGLDKVSASVRSNYQSGNTEYRYNVTQAIEPNNDRLDARAGFSNLPWRSVWFEESEGEDSFLGMKGFEEFPSMVVRWDATMLDDYGINCPGMVALSGQKQLQVQERRKGQAIDKMVNPHLQVPPTLKGVRSFLPGGTTVYDQTTPHGGIRPIHDVNMRLDYLLNDIQAVEHRINESYYVDLFMMISQQDDVRTATEIALRNEEKLLVLGPALQRVQTELLDPLIDRTFSIMERAGAIPLPPPELEGQPLKVKYVSMLAQAQQSVVASSVERFISNVGHAAQMNPGVLDKVDFDATVDEFGEILGVPQRMIRTSEQVSELRAQREEQAQQAQALEAAGQLANVAKAAGEIDLDGNNPVSALVGGSGG